MKTIVGVRFRKPGKVYFFDPGYIQLNLKDKVVVETTMGEDVGEVVINKRQIPDDKVSTELKRIVRLANNRDLKKVEDNKIKEQKAMKVCKEKIKKHKLDMNLVDVEYKFDNSKIIFYFTADGRVDFRELVKDLAAIYKTRIELRQIGVRDEVRKIGGNGVCGRELCCCSFLNNFDMVSIKMAKEQSASLNPSKISGNCGRLMCCLKYEQEVYEDKIKKLPKVGSIVKTEDGEGTVVTQEVLQEAIKVQFRKDDITTYKTYPAKDVKVIKNASGNDKDSIENTVDSEEMANLKELQKLEELEKRDKIIEKEEKDEYSITLKITKPEITINDIGTEAFPDMLSTFTTKYDRTNINRTTNLQLAINKINGVVLMPDEEFSYNKIVGERTIAAGYKDAKIYSNGEVVDGLGGGICQISSTLYNTVLLANLEITERRNHQFITSYLPAGRDATVVYGSQDFKFKNNRKYPVKIEATLNSGIAKISLYGVKEENDYTVTFETKTISAIPYKTKYIEDNSLEEGVEKIQQKGTNGLVTETYKILSLNGAVVSKTLLSKDTYNAMQRVVVKGTKKVKKEKEENNDNSKEDSNKNNVDNKKENDKNKQ